MFKDRGQYDHDNDDENYDNDDGDDDDDSNVDDDGVQVPQRPDDKFWQRSRCFCARGGSNNS